MPNKIPLTFHIKLERLGAPLIIVINHFQRREVVYDGIGGTAAAFHSRRNTFAHRVEETSRFAREQDPALPIKDGASGLDAGHQPLFCFNLLPNLQAMPFFHTGDKPLIKRFYIAGVFDRNAQHQHFVFHIEPGVILG